MPFAHAITAITSPKIMTLAIPAQRSIHEVFDSSCGMNGPPDEPKYSVDARYVPTAPATKPSRKTTGDMTHMATMRGTTIDRTGSTPITRSASSSSRIFRAPNSAVYVVPITPAKTAPVIVTPNSRIRPTPRNAALRSLAPSCSSGTPSASPMMLRAKIAFTASTGRITARRMNTDWIAASRSQIGRRVSIDRTASIPSTTAAPRFANASWNTSTPARGCGAAFLSTVGVDADPPVVNPIAPLRPGGLDSHDPHTGRGVVGTLSHAVLCGAPTPPAAGPPGPLQRLDPDRQAVDRGRARAEAHRRRVAGADIPAVAQEHLVEDRLDLHATEVHADALVDVAAERDPGVLVRGVLAALLGEALRVEAVGVAPPRLHPLAGVDAQHQVGPVRDVVTDERRVLDRAAHQGADGRAHAQGLAHHEVHALQLVERGMVELHGPERPGLLAKALLPLRVAAEEVDHHRQRDRARVVRRHEHEDHVVDHVLVAEALALLGLGVAQDAEQVVAVAGALGRDLGAEVVLEQAPAAQPAVPAAAGDVGADQRGATHDGVHERPVERVGARAELVADEDLGRHVERELLGSRVDVELGVIAPVIDAAGDRRVHPLEVGDEPLVLERLLHDPAVQAVLLEVHEHHAATEERADEVAPALLVGERAVAVGEHLADRLGPEHRHAPDAERVGPRQLAEALQLLARERQVVADDLQRVADDRQPGRAHDRLQAAAGRRRRERAARRVGQPPRHGGDRLLRAEGERRAAAHGVEHG